MKNIETFLDNLLNLNLENNYSFYYLIIILLTLFSILFNSLIANLVVNKIKKIIKKTNNQVDDHLFLGLLPPCRILPIMFVFFLLSLNFDKSSSIGFYISQINITKLFL